MSTTPTIASEAIATKDVWLTILGLSIGSFLLRFSFLGLIGDRPLPAWLLRHLRYTAVAILPALVAPLVIFPEATGGALDAPRLTAAIATLIIGWWRKDVLLGILAGASTLFIMEIATGQIVL